MFSRQSLHIAMLVWGCIFSLIAALCMVISSKFEPGKRRRLIVMQLSCAVLLLSDAFAWGFRGAPGSVAGMVVHISNFLVFLLSDMLVYLFNDYMSYTLFQKNIRAKHRVRIVNVIAFTGMALVILSQFTHIYYFIDSHNFYHRNNLYPLSAVLPMIGIVIDMSIILQYRRNVSQMMMVSLMSYIALPFVAMGIQTFYYGISLTNIAISISMVLMFVVAMIEQNETISRKEKENADMQIAIMRSQIAPHFIFNTLASIKALCRKNPGLAEETIVAFAQYLRCNLDSMETNELIPFEHELKHVKCYLAIEKIRFEERVNIIYDIQEENFFLPALTLQPMVENAVKHGLCNKLEGGTVKISTSRTGNIVCVRVEDDGAGFDMHIVEKDDRIHIGIRNVASRIEKMCAGTFQIESKIGKGTVVTFLLPQQTV